MIVRVSGDGRLLAASSKDTNPVHDDRVGHLAAESGQVLVGSPATFEADNATFALTAGHPSRLQGRAQRSRPAQQLLDRSDRAKRGCD